MSAKLAEKLTEVGELFAQLGEAFTELSALYDATAAKSKSAGNDGTTGKVAGRKGTSKVAQEEDDLPEPKAASRAKKPAGKKKVTEEDVRAAAKKVIDKFGKEDGKEKVSEILGGKLADVDEDDYGEKLGELEAALEEDDDV